MIINNKKDGREPTTTEERLSPARVALWLSSQWSKVPGVRLLDRHEAISFAPPLIMAGALDDNVLPEIQEKFVAAYRAAGGEVQFQIFEGAGARVGRQRRAANRPGAGNGQGVHRASIEEVNRRTHTDVIHGILRNVRVRK